MVLRRLSESLKAQNWAVVFSELLIVIVGVYIGIQANTWNEERLDAQRREQIIGALVTSLSDAVSVQRSEANGRRDRNRIVIVGSGRRGRGTTPALFLPHYWIGYPALHMVDVRANAANGSL